MPNKQKLKVFISHASLDSNFAEKLFQLLVKSNCEPWLDTRTLLVGSRWEDVIEEAMSATDLIVVILSAAAAAREGYLRREVKIAARIADEKLHDVPFLIPIRLEVMRLPPALSQYSWLDTFAPDFNEKLSHALKARALFLDRVPPEHREEAWDFPISKIGAIRNWVAENEVKESDIQEVVAIARRLHPTHPRFADLEQIFERWRKRTPEAFHFITAITGGATRRIGYTCVLPLQKKTYQLYSSGQLSEWNLGLPDFPIMRRCSEWPCKYLLIQSIELEVEYRRNFLGDPTWFHTLSRHLGTFNHTPLESGAEIVADGNVIGEQLLTKAGFRRIASPESGATADPRPLFQLRFKEPRPTAAEKRTISVLARYMQAYGTNRREHAI